MQFSFGSIEYNNVYTTDENGGKSDFYKRDNNIWETFKGKFALFLVISEYLSEVEFDPQHKVTS